LGKQGGVGFLFIYNMSDTQQAVLLSLVVPLLLSKKIILKINSYNILMNEGFIYKLNCKNINVSDFYIGATDNLHKCQINLKHCSTNIKRTSPLYEFIRKNGGYSNFIFNVIQKCNINDLYKEKRKQIELLKPSLNKKIPTRTKKEYCKANRPKINAYKKSRRSICPACKITIGSDHLNRHFKTKKHAKNLIQFNKNINISHLIDTDTDSESFDV